MAEAEIMIDRIDCSVWIFIFITFSYFKCLIDVVTSEIKEQIG